jgi:uncharacterized protein (TIGR02145 family)
VKRNCRSIRGFSRLLPLATFMRFSRLLPLATVAMLTYFTGSCSKEVTERVPDIYGKWTDTTDGKVYLTLQLGDQVWMVDNINRGEMIPGTQKQTDNGKIEKYCYDDNPVLCEKYGGLYQWAEAMQYSTTESSGGICPPGWHIPSDNEWKILELFLGMSRQDADDILWRMTGPGKGIHPGKDTGFEALMGGNRFLNGSFNHIGNSGYFWTSTKSADNHAWRRGVSNQEQGIYRSENHMEFGFSVRCLKY